MVRRTHHCRRCDAAIDPGDVYAAVDVLDGDGRLRTLLCRECAVALRSFIDPDWERGDDDPAATDDGGGTPGADGSENEREAGNEDRSHATVRRGQASDDVDGTE